MRRPSHRWALIGLSAFTVAALSAAFWVGRAYTLREFRSSIRAASLGSTVGSMLDADAKRQLVATYGVPDMPPEALDTFCWVPVLTPTAFVGGLPAPGVHTSAKVNQLQFRDARELRRPKPAGVYRIFLTGGSTAFGTGASGNEATIGAVLERELRAGPLSRSLGEIEVFTLATPGWTTTHERIAIENFLSELSPDLVISLSGNNDVHWALGGYNVLWGRTGFDENVFHWLRQLFRSSCGIELSDAQPSSGQRLDARLVQDRLLKNVDLIDHVLSRSASKYVFALQPTMAAVDKRLTPREAGWLARIPEAEQAFFRDCYRRFAEELGAKLGIRFFDLRSAFDKATEEELFLDLYHFGDRGNNLIARQLADHLEAHLQKF